MNAATGTALDTLLLVDIGNSRIKAALATHGDWLALAPLATAAPDLGIWEAALAGCTPARVLASSVAGASAGQALVAFAARHWQCTVEFAKVRVTHAGMTTRYRDPAQLGIDRWLAALAAWCEAQGPVCVIDAGTALTVDIVDADASHRGGLIAPGPELMRESLSRGTARLASTHLAPVLDFADNTEDAISLGCTEATRGLIASVAERLASRAAGQDYRWYLTGGAAPLVRALCARPWHEAPALVLHGLARYAEAGA